MTANRESHLDVLLRLGGTGRDDVRYVWSTFPIIERQDVQAFGRYRSRDLCLAYMNALAAGRPDATPDV